MTKLAQHFVRRWFLLSLLAVIPGGLRLGAVMGTEGVHGLATAIGPSTKSWLVAGVLLLMSLTLPAGRLGAALRRPGPVLWCVVVTYLLIPLAALPLSRLQLTADFSMGLMIAASVPCTMAAASVWTRRAGGNDAVSLLVTLVTNGACFLVTPLWIQFAMRMTGAITEEIPAMRTGALMQRLIYTALLPILAGQLARILAPIARAADRWKVPLGVVAQSCILLIILWTAIEGGPRLREGPGAIGGVAAIAWVWACCIALHLSAMLVGLLGARWAGFATGDRVAVAFAASQKTLPIGVAVASGFAAHGLPFAVFPMLMYHASQLFIDTSIADRLRRQTAAAAADTASSA